MDSDNKRSVDTKRRESGTTSRGDRSRSRERAWSRDHHRRRDEKPRHNHRLSPPLPAAYRRHSSPHRRDTDKRRHDRRDDHRGRSRSRSPTTSLTSVRGNKNFERAKALGLLEQDKVAAAAAAAALNAQQLANKLGHVATPQEAAQKQMQQLASVSGISVPAYYNPAAVNPLRMAEQIQKRKMLWAKPSDTPPPAATDPQASTSSAPAAATNINSATFFAKAAFDDEKSTEKFRKLMGIKETTSVVAKNLNSKDVQSKQEELYRDLDQQYEAARVSTHMMRGVGLGFYQQPK